MMVLEKVSARPMIAAVRTGMPSPRATPAPASAVSSTCALPVTSATGPSVRSSPGSSFRPTRNSSTATPSSPSTCTCTALDTTPSTSGPATMPATMKATISGWRSHWPTKPSAAPSTSKAAVSLKTVWAVVMVEFAAGEPTRQQIPCQSPCRHRPPPARGGSENAPDQNGLTIVRHTTATRTSVGSSLKTRKKRALCVLRPSRRSAR